MDMPATTLTDRAVLRLSGQDVGPFLDGLVTNHVGDDLPVWAGLLTPQGKCLFDFFVFADGDNFLIDGEAAHIEALAKRLSMYKLRRKIDVAVDPDLAVHWAADGDAGAADPRHPNMGRRWIGPAGEPATGYDAHRLRLGICEGNAELGDLLWLECNAGELNGVSFTKGCFVGQELTARIDSRGGNVPRHLRAIVLDEPVEEGAAVECDGPAATVTTAAVSERLGPIALAFLGRAVAEGAEVTVGGVRGVVHVLPVT